MVAEDASVHYGCHHPNIVYTMGQSELKGEDVIFVEHDRAWPGSDLTEHSMMSSSSIGSMADLDSAQTSRWIPYEAPPSCQDCGTQTNNYSLYAVFDGHNGVHAAKMAGDALLALLESKLPLGCPPPPEHELFTRWREGIQLALIETIVELNRLFAQRGIHAGCTATLVLVAGWLVTSVNLGDSRAILDTGTEVISLSQDHRIATNKGERRRLEAMGAIVAPISMSGSGPADDVSNGVGPLRIWPGGLCISRAIGDFDVGDSVLPFPHVTQVLVPPTGGRLLVASDGVWDAFDKMSRAGAMSRSWSAESVPTRMIQTIVRAFGGLKDDTSLVCVDVLPSGTTFPQVVSDMKRSGGSISGSYGGTGNGNGMSSGGGGGGGLCGCFGSSPTLEVSQSLPMSPSTPVAADSSVNPSVRSMASSNPSSRGKPRASILVDLDVAAVMGLMPDVELVIPGWYNATVGEDLFRSASEAAEIWHAEHSRRYGRPPATPAMPDLERVSRRGRKVAFAKEAMQKRSGNTLSKSASHAYLGATAESGDDYAAKFGHYKSGNNLLSEPSVRAGRMYNSDASVRAGTALKNSDTTDPSVHVRGSNMDKSVHFKASTIEDADGLAPVRVVKRGNSGPQSRPVDVPNSRSIEEPNDSVRERMSLPQSLASIGE